MIGFVLGKTLAKILVNPSQLMDGAMEHQGQPGIAKSTEEFLTFAERIAEEHGRFAIVQGFPAKSYDPFHHGISGWENILRLTISGFHDEHVRGARFAWLRR